MNIAAKIQGKAKPQEILIGEDVYNRIHPSVQKEFSKKIWNEGEWKYHSRDTGELYPVYHHSRLNCKFVGAFYVFIMVFCKLFFYNIHHNFM